MAIHSKRILGAMRPGILEAYRFLFVSWKDHHAEYHRLRTLENDLTVNHFIQILSIIPPTESQEEEQVQSYSLKLCINKALF